MTRRACATPPCCGSCKPRSAPPCSASPRDRDGAAIASQLKALRARLESGRVDHSIGLLMLERAEAALDTNTAVGRQTAAGHRDRRRLPRYFAALEPARPSATPRGAGAPAVTVTLVRWPFT